MQQRKQENTTPMMKQYLDIKRVHQDCLLFYRMGDFYELFFEDAIIAVEVLHIALTKRGKMQGEDIPMCGVPHHSHEQYLQKLIKSGHKVAICEQLETPQEAKKRGYKTVVRRDVTRIITPGTLLEDALLDAKQYNYLCSVAQCEGKLSIACVEISTGVFFVYSISSATVNSDIARFSPKEIIISDKLFQDEKLRDSLSGYMRYISTRANSVFDYLRATQRLKDFYGIMTLESLGNYNKAQVCAMGSLLEYLEHTQKANLPRLKKPKIIDTAHFMQIDPATCRSLELVESASGSKKNSLLGTLDKTMTACGGRLLSLYLALPLSDAKLIEQRLDNVEYFLKHTELQTQVRDLLKHFPDIERALSRVFVAKGMPKDLVLIRDGMAMANTISGLLVANLEHLPKGIQTISAQLINDSRLLNELQEALNLEMPANLKGGGFVRSGYNAQLDSLYDLQKNAKKNLDVLRDKYRNSTGVSNLKVSHNNVIGYFVEVSPSNANKIPDDVFEHRQTLGSSVRYTTVELRELESNLVNCGERIAAIEQEIFYTLCALAMDNAEVITAIAQAIAGADLYSTFALLAQQNDYVRPTIDDSTCFDIIEGRHPVVQKSVGDKFIPNSCNLGEQSNLWLITGPNMAGKSTFLRQNALIAVMAQIGCFVPAKSAHIGVVDKIFSRVGAADDISRGQSTFMVEMVETATILNNATDKSLVILDEIGRGTATYDGLSIAWAVVENLHNTIECRTLFATHYHELTDLEGMLERVSCHTVKVKEWERKIIFMHEVCKGKGNRSYGINVAELAGIPRNVTQRAEVILQQLQQEDNRDIKLVVEEAANQNSDYNQEVIERLMAIDVDALTPRDAFDVLYTLKNMIR